MSAEAGNPATAAGVGPTGVGGWLILPVVGLMLTMVKGLMLLFSGFPAGEATAGLSDGQKAVLVAEIAGNAILGLLLPLVLLILLQQRKRAFPRLYVLWACLAMAFLAADLVAARALFGDAFGEGRAPFFDGETIRVIVGTAVAGLIWAPYMLVSRRVRNTFTN